MSQMQAVPETSAAYSGPTSECTRQSLCILPLTLPLLCVVVSQAGDTLHILHVIAPARRLVVTPDLGLEGVIEDDEETRRKVVSSTRDTGRQAGRQTDTSSHFPRTADKHV